MSNNSNHCTHKWHMRTYTLPNIFSNDLTNNIIQWLFFRHKLARSNCIYHGDCMIYLLLGKKKKNHIRVSVGS